MASPLTVIEPNCQPKRTKSTPDDGECRPLEDLPGSAARGQAHLPPHITPLYGSEHRELRYGVKLFELPQQTLAYGRCDTLNSVNSVEDAEVLFEAFVPKNQSSSVNQLPLGALSEEAQETSNKLHKEYRQFHTRKFSPEATNLDILRIFLAKSDTVIVCVRNRIRKRHSEYPEDMKSLLMLDDS